MIDSHTHLDLVEQYHPDRIDWLIQNGCRVISWAFGNNIHTEQDLLSYFQAQVVSIYLKRVSFFRELMFFFK